MLHEDRDYYRRRAADERECERSASSEAAARIHALIADTYEMMAQENPSHLRLVPEQGVMRSDAIPEERAATG